MSAGPPQRSDVWKPSGSLKRTSPRISPSMPSPSRPRRRTGLARGQALAHLVRDRSHVARPEGQDQVARPGDARRMIHHLGPVAHVSDVDGPCAPDPLGQVRAWTPGIGASPAG